MTRAKSSCGAEPARPRDNQDKAPHLVVLGVSTAQLALTIRVRFLFHLGIDPNNESMRPLISDCHDYRKQIVSAMNKFTQS